MSSLVRVTGRSFFLARPRKTAGRAVTVPGCPRCMLTIDPRRTVYIDDVEANVVAARPFGIHAIHFPTAASLRAELVALGLLPSRPVAASQT